MEDQEVPEIEMDPKYLEPLTIFCDDDLDGNKLLDLFTLYPLGTNYFSFKQINKMFKQLDVFLNCDGLSDMHISLDGFLDIHKINPRYFEHILSNEIAARYKDCQKRLSNITQSADLKLLECLNEYSKSITKIEPEFIPAALMCILHSLAYDQSSSFREKLLLPQIRSGKGYSGLKRETLEAKANKLFEILKDTSVIRYAIFEKFEYQYNEIVKRLAKATSYDNSLSMEEIERGDSVAMQIEESRTVMLDIIKAAEDSFSKVRKCAGILEHEENRVKRPSGNFELPKDNCGVRGALFLYTVLTGDKPTYYKDQTIHTPASQFVRDAFEDIGYTTESIDPFSNLPGKIKSFREEPLYLEALRLHKTYEASDSPIPLIELGRISLPMSASLG